MSDTPETDAVEFVAQPGMMPPFNTTPSAHARRLERERNEARQAFAIATDQLVQVQGELRQAREENAKLREWHGLTDAGLRLRLGELTAQEIRTLRAVLNAILAEENMN